MKTPLLLLDGDNLCYRSWYSLRNIRGEQGTNRVLFGLLRDLVFLSQALESNKFVFCFDQGPSIRAKTLPTYKGNRLLTEERKEVKRQIARIKEKHLDEIGYSNVFAYKGYEADDLIAFLCKEGRYHPILIVSTDTDLFQLLRPGISIWNPITKSTLGAKGFHKRFGIYPASWAWVKAITGCSSDNIPGIPGVGTTTAIKYLQETLNENTKTCKAILQGQDIIQTNHDLVKLPHASLKTPMLSLVQDQVCSTSWDNCVTKLNMPSLKGKCPI